jgi:hypothetical protein
LGRNEAEGANACFEQREARRVAVLFASAIVTQSRASGPQHPDKGG